MPNRTTSTSHTSAGAGAGPSSAGMSFSPSKSSLSRPDSSSSSSRPTSPTGITFDEQALLQSPSLLAKSRARRRSAAAQGQAAAANASGSASAAASPSGGGTGSGFAGSGQVKYLQETAGARLQEHAVGDGDGDTTITATAADHAPAHHHQQQQQHSHHRSGSAATAQRALRRAGNASALSQLSMTSSLAGRSSVRSSARGASRTGTGKRVVVVNTRPSWAQDDVSSASSSEEEGEQAAQAGPSRIPARAANGNGKQRQHPQSQPQHQHEHQHHHPHLHGRAAEKARARADAATRAQGSSVDPAHCGDTDDEDEEAEEDDGDEGYEDITAPSSPVAGPISASALRKRAHMHRHRHAQVQTPSVESTASAAVPSSSKSGAAKLSKQHHQSFWMARKTKRRIKRKRDARDGGEGVTGVVAARDAARRYGSMDFGGTYRQSKGRDHQQHRQGQSGAKMGAAPEQGDVRPKLESREGSSSDDAAAATAAVGEDGEQRRTTSTSSGEESSANNGSSATVRGAGGDLESGLGALTLPAAVMRARLKPRNPDGPPDLRIDTSFANGEREPKSWEDITRHQPLSPGWASPWRPEARGDRNSIEVGRYRFHATGADGYHPHKKSGSVTSEKVVQGTRRLVTWAFWRHFLLYNPFGPLFFRFVNIAFASATLAVAIQIHRSLQAENATSIVGASPIMAIIFSPLTLCHVAFQIYLEYFGRPIGLWSVRGKLAGTLLEIIFVALWAAELALAFDNYFTSPLICYPFNSPFNAQREICNSNNAPSLSDDSRKPYICRLQGVLIGLAFMSLLLYTLALTVSLFRIIVRVTARSGHNGA